VVKLFVTDAGDELLRTAPLPAQGALLDGLTRMDEEQLGALDNGLKALVEILSIKDEGSALAPMPPGKS
jgi:MarR family transcriptional regulator, organic hydroperoxide resistance regulator